MILRIALALASAFAAFAQPEPAMQQIGHANLPAQPIGPNDLLAISVYRSPELTRTIRVDPGGAIDLPLLPDPVRAAGLLPNALERAVASALRSAGLFVDPVVKIAVVEYASRPVSVVGAVRKPLTFQAIGKTTLLDALARAEGLNDFAGTEILVSLNGETRRIAAALLFNGADPAHNLTLHGGEEVRVPEAGKIYVVGNVRRPGVFPVRDRSPITLLKILAVAEGLAPFAAKEAYLYRPDPATGVKTEIPIALDKIMKRKSPDIPLAVDDILYIPDNTGKRIGLAALEKAVLFGSTAGATALVWRR